MYNKLVINCLSVDVMITQDVLLVVSQLHFFDLECRMVDLVLATEIR